ncbi:MAG: pantothenate kinase [Treponema sp.]|jgi:type II pantothenate kinase|nr:pantothenate kinase [Treponema sp.]
MIIGIDIGSTTTKAVSIEQGAVVKKIKTKAIDAVTSATGAFGKMLIENDIQIAQIERIMITGAGAAKIKSDLFGIPTKRVDEITAIGVGGMFLSQKDAIVIANIGTGTAIIEAKKGSISHMGGSGVGGGAILGLAKKMLGISHFDAIMELAKNGSLSQVDLLLEDITDTGISFLNKEATASNFGKTLDSARHEDIALGILNMVYQVIGMLSVFAAKSKNLDRVIVTGNGSANPIGQNVLATITSMYNIHFEYPADAVYATAVGAAIGAELADPPNIIL